MWNSNRFDVIINFNIISVLVLPEQIVLLSVHHSSQNRGWSQYQLYSRDITLWEIEIIHAQEDWTAEK
jgi:hypothetical protein